MGTAGGEPVTPHTLYGPQVPGIVFIVRPPETALNNSACNEKNCRRLILTEPQSRWVTREVDQEHGRGFAVRASERGAQPDRKECAVRIFGQQRQRFSELLGERVRNVLPDSPLQCRSNAAALGTFVGSDGAHDDPRGDRADGRSQGAHCTGAHTAATGTRSARPAAEGAWSGTSSAPTSRSNALHPEAGWLRTRAAFGRWHSAADPSAHMPSNRVHHQQGCGSDFQGLKWEAGIAP